MAKLDRSRLPANWRESPCPPELLSSGDAWAVSSASVVLEVPSAVVVNESNYLITPDHPDFTSLVIDPPQPFAFDSRLLG